MILFVINLLVECTTVFDYSTLLVQHLSLVLLLHVIHAQVVTRCQTNTFRSIGSVKKLLLYLIKLRVSARSINYLDRLCMWIILSIVIQPSKSCA